MLKKLLSVAVLIATCSGAMAESGQLGANQIWGNPTASGAPSKPSNIGSYLTQGTGITISGTPKATIGLTNQITAGGPTGSATQTPVITYNAQGQLTVVSLATIAPPFSAVTGSLACSQHPALTGFVTSPAGSCATSLGATITIAQGGTGQVTQAAAISALMPTPTRTGDVAFWNGSIWTTLAGNNSGSQVFTENASGVPSWTTPGTGTVTSAQISAGLGISVATTAGANPCITTCNLTVNQSLTNATLNTGVAGTPATGTATPVMAGLGSTCKITPVYSGRVWVQIFGNITNNTSANSATYSSRYGTGVAPGNNTVSSGIGAIQQNSVTLTYPTGGQNLAFNSSGILTGLTTGTAYWFDLTYTASANTTTLSNINCVVMEF